MAFCVSACGKAEEEPPVSPAEGFSLRVDYALEDKLVNGEIGSELLLPVLSPEDDSHPELASALEEWNAETEAFLRGHYEEYHLLAKAQADAGTFNYGTYYSRGTAEVSRADSSVLSLLLIETSYSGGTHPGSLYKAVNVDTASGNRLALSDIVTDENALKTAILDRVVKTHPDSQFLDPEAYLDMAFSGETELTWTLNGEGLKIWFSPETVAPYSEGLMTVTIPYDDSEIKFKNAYANPPLDYSADSLLVHNTEHEAALRTICSMTSWERVCQLFIAMPQHLSGSLTSHDEKLAEGLKKYPVGGILYVMNNITTPENTVAMNRVMVDNLRISPFLCIDEEGGRVARLRGKPYAATLDPMFSYKDQGTDVAYQNARRLSDNLYAYGFNLDFAPVADVWTNPVNKVIGDRAYSDDPYQAAELITAAIKGFHDGGMFCCVKHFPGHGDTAEDSHTGAAIVHKNLDELRECELIPFIAGIEAGADMVMIGHLTCPKLDDVPASISYKIITELLREELGYEGVILTDSLKMGAVSGMGSAELCLAAFNAGCDMLLSPDDLAEAVNYFYAGLSNGVVTIERVNESITRILNMKKSYINLQDGRQ